MSSFTQRLSLLIATGAGAGYLPIAPGSWGSLAAVVIGWWLLSWSWWWYVLALPVVFTVAVWSAGRADPYFFRKTGKEHDNKYIVIDEWVGQLITLLPLLYFGRSVWTLAIGLFLFRAFDTAKFGLAGYWDKQGNRWGVVLDDVFAGVHAALVLSLGLWIASQFGWLADVLQLFR